MIESKVIVAWTLAARLPELWGRYIIAKRLGVYV